MFLRGSLYPLYYPQYISGYEKVKMYTTIQTSMMEMEPLIDQCSLDDWEK